MPLSSRPSAWFRLSGALVWFVPLVALVACRRSAPPEEGPARCVLPPHEPAPPASRTAPADVNVLGGPLAICGTSPLTGVYRDGRCATGADDVGVHVVCAAVTEPFLRFTAARGNDLVTPRGGFPGLRPGDRWCLCASRWAEAEANGVAPPVVAEATHARAAELLGRERLLAPAR